MSSQNIFLDLYVANRWAKDDEFKGLHKTIFWNAKVHDFTSWSDLRKRPYYSILDLSDAVLSNVLRFMGSQFSLEQWLRTTGRVYLNLTSSNDEGAETLIRHRNSEGLVWIVLQSECPKDNYWIILRHILGGNKQDVAIPAALASRWQRNGIESDRQYRERVIRKRLETFPILVKEALKTLATSIYISRVTEMKDAWWKKITIEESIRQRSVEKGITLTDIEIGEAVARYRSDGIRKTQEGIVLELQRYMLESEPRKIWTDSIIPSFWRDPDAFDTREGYFYEYYVQAIAHVLYQIIMTNERFARIFYTQMDEAGRLRQKTSG